ncbi:MAG TPA: helicase-related protein [Candidatus Omnitrophota bacterium]|nr:helicase-related protein [Candidatus Omnitrophota bacterium]
MPDHNKTTFSLPVRAIAMFVLFAFTSTTIAWSAPSVGTEVKELSREIKINQLAERITVPSEIGIIKEIHTASPASALSPQFSGLIVHLEDAHGSVEAQLHQEAILRHLRKEYGLDTIFVEGGLGDLRPELLSFLEDEKRNSELINKLTEKGLVGGVERFLATKSPDQRLQTADHSLKTKDFKAIAPVSSLKSSVRAFGVESAELYRRELELFREVYAHKAESDQFLNGIRRQLLAQSASGFNKELKAFFKEWLFQEEVQKDILSHLSFLQKYAVETLNLDLTDAREQYDWPQLVRFFKLKNLEGLVPRDSELARDEMQKLAQWLNDQKLDDLNKELELFFNEPRGASFESRGETFRTRMEKFYAKVSPRGFRFEDYPALTKRIGSIILSQEIQTGELLQEMERLNAKILEALAKTQEEKRGIAQYQEYLLLKKLFSLELTREEFKQMGLAPRDSLLEKTRGQAESRIPSSEPPAREVYSRALEFYEIAQQREEAIFKNMLAKMKSIKQPNAVLITGGFHSEGLSEFLKAKGVSYVRIAPRISGKMDDANYLRIMTLGQCAPAARSSARFATLTNDPKSLDAATVEFIRAELRTSIREIADDVIPSNEWIISKDLLGRQSEAMVPRDSGLGTGFKNESLGTSDKSRAEGRSEAREEEKDPSALEKEFERLFPSNKELMLALFGEIVLQNKNIEKFFYQLMAIYGLASWDGEHYQSTTKRPLSPEQALYFVSLLRLEGGGFLGDEYEFIYKTKKGKRTVEKTVAYTDLDPEYLEWAVKYKIPIEYFPLTYSLFIDKKEGLPQTGTTKIAIRAGNQLGEELFREFIEKRGPRVREPLVNAKGVDPKNLRWLKIHPDSHLSKIADSHGIDPKDLKLGFEKEGDQHSVYLFTANETFNAEASRRFDASHVASIPIGFVSIRYDGNTPFIYGYQPRFFIPSHGKEDANDVVGRTIKGGMLFLEAFLEKEISKIVSAKKPVKKLHFPTPSWHLVNSKVAGTTAFRYYYEFPKEQGFQLVLATPESKAFNMGKSWQPHWLLEKHIEKNRSEMRGSSISVKWSEKIAKLKQTPDYRLLAYLLKNTGLSEIEKNRYITLWLMMAISAPLTGSLKFVFAAGAASLAAVSPWFVMAPPLVVLLLSPLFRLVFFVGPFWAASGFKMKLDWLIPANFVPGLGAFIAVPAQILKSLKGEYRQYQNMSVRKLRQLVYQLDGILSEHRMNLPQEDLDAIRSRLPMMAFKVLEFQAAHPGFSLKKNGKENPEAILHLESVDLLPVRLESLIREKTPTIFLGSGQESFNTLRQRIPPDRLPGLDFYQFDLSQEPGIEKDSIQPLAARSEARHKGLFSNVTPLDKIVEKHKQWNLHKVVDVLDRKAREIKTFFWWELLEQWRTDGGSFYFTSEEKNFSESLRRASDDQFKEQVERLLRTSFAKRDLILSSKKDYPTFDELINSFETGFLSFYSNLFGVLADEAVSGRLPAAEKNWKVLMPELIRRWNENDSARSEMRNDIEKNIEKILEQADVRIRSGDEVESEPGVYAATPPVYLTAIEKVLQIDPRKELILIEAGHAQGLLALRLAMKHPNLRIIGIEGRPSLYEDSKKILEAAIELRFLRPEQVHFYEGDLNDEEFSKDYEAADIVYYYNYGADDETKFALTLADHLKYGARVVVFDGFLDGGEADHFSQALRETEVFEGTIVQGVRSIPVFKKTLDTQDVSLEGNRSEVRNEAATSRALPGASKRFAYAEEVARVVGLLGELRQLDNTRVLAQTENGVGEENWSRWIQHHMAGKLHVFFGYWNSFNESGDIEDLETAEKGLQEAENIFESRKSFKEALQNDFDHFHLNPPLEKVRSGKPLFPLELVHYFLHKVFVENPNAQKNREVYARVIQDLEEAFYEMREAFERVKTEKYFKTAEELEKNPPANVSSQKASSEVLRHFRVYDGMDGKLYADPRVWYRENFSGFDHFAAIGPGEIVFLTLDEGATGAVASLGHHECLSLAIRARAGNKNVIGLAHVFYDIMAGNSQDSYVKYLKILDHLHAQKEWSDIQIILTENNVFHGFPKGMNLDVLKREAADRGIQVSSAEVWKFGTDAWVDIIATPQEVFLRKREGTAPFRYEPKDWGAPIRTDPGDPRTVSFMPSTLVSEDGEEFEVSYEDGSVDGQRTIKLLYDGQPVATVDFRIDPKQNAAILDYNNDGPKRYVGIEVNQFFSERYSGIGTALMGLAFRVARDEGIPEFYVLHSKADGFYEKLGMIKIRDGVFRFPLEDSEREKQRLSFPPLRIRSNPRSELRKKKEEDPNQLKLFEASETKELDPENALMRQLGYAWEQMKQAIQSPEELEKALYEKIPAVKKAVEFLGFQVVEENRKLFVTDPVFKRKIQFRAYQVLLAAHAARGDAMVILPTGLGKTIVAVLVVGYLLKQAPQKKILITANSNLLVEQHADTFDQYFESDIIAKIGESDNEEGRRSLWRRARIVIATNDLVVADPGVFLIDDIGYLIVDEAHRVGAAPDDRYAGTRLVQAYREKNPDGKLLGLTASPRPKKELKGWQQNLRLSDTDFFAASEEDSWIYPYVIKRNAEIARAERDAKFPLLFMILRFLEDVFKVVRTTDIRADFEDARQKVLNAWLEENDEKIQKVFDGFLQDTARQAAASSQRVLMQEQYGPVLELIRKVRTELVPQMFDLKASKAVRIAEWAALFEKPVFSDPKFLELSVAVRTSFETELFRKAAQDLETLIDRQKYRIYELWQQNLQKSLLNVKGDMSRLSHEKIERLWEKTSEEFRDNPDDFGVAYKAAVEAKNWKEKDRLDVLVTLNQLWHLRGDWIKYGPEKFTGTIQTKDLEAKASWKKRTRPALERTSVLDAASWFQKSREIFPKEKILLDLLRPVQGKPHDRTAIFVDDKKMARRLVELIKKEFPDLRVAMLVGRGMGGSDEGMTPREQERVRDDFNKGKLDILVGTDVMAEGLNLQGLRRVIEYTPARRAIEKIQRQGRVSRFEEGWVLSLVTPWDRSIYFGTQQRVEATRRLIRDLQKRNPYTEFRSETRISLRTERNEVPVRAEMRASVAEEIEERVSSMYDKGDLEVGYWWFDFEEYDARRKDPDYPTLPTDRISKIREAMEEFRDLRTDKNQMIYARNIHWILGVPSVGIMLIHLLLLAQGDGEVYWKTSFGLLGAVALLNYFFSRVVDYTTNEHPYEKILDILESIDRQGPDESQGPSVRSEARDRVSQLAQNFVIQNPNGIHLRPAAGIVKIAQQIFAALGITVWLQKSGQGERVPAQSETKVALLGLRQGDSVTVILDSREGESYPRRFFEKIMKLWKKLFNDPEALKAGLSGEKGLPYFSAITSLVPEKDASRRSEIRTKHPPQKRVMKFRDVAYYYNNFDKAAEIFKKILKASEKGVINAGDRIWRETLPAIKSYYDAYNKRGEIPEDFRVMAMLVRAIMIFQMLMGKKTSIPQTSKPAKRSAVSENHFKDRYRFWSDAALFNKIAEVLKALKNPDMAAKIRDPKLGLPQFDTPQMTRLNELAAMDRFVHPEKLELEDIFTRFDRRHAAARGETSFRSETREPLLLDGNVKLTAIREKLSDISELHLDRDIRKAVAMQIRRVILAKQDRLGWEDLQKIEGLEDLNLSVLKENFKLPVKTPVRSLKYSRRFAWGLAGLLAASALSIAGWFKWESSRARQSLTATFQKAGDVKSEIYQDLEKVYFEKMPLYNVFPAALYKDPLYFPNQEWGNYHLTVIGDIHTHPDTPALILDAARLIAEDPQQWVLLVEGYEEWKKNRNENAVDLVLLDELIKRTKAPVLDFVPLPSDADVLEGIQERLEFSKEEILNISCFLKLGFYFTVADDSGRPQEWALEKTLNLMSSRTGLPKEYFLNQLTALAQSLKDLDDVGLKKVWEKIVRFQLIEIEARNTVGQKRVREFLSKYPNRKNIFVITGSLHLPIFDIRLPPEHQPMTLPYDFFTESLSRYYSVLELNASSFRSEIRGDTKDSALAWSHKRTKELLAAMSPAVQDTISKFLKEKILRHRNNRLMEWSRSLKNQSHAAKIKNDIEQWSGGIESPKGKKNEEIIALIEPWLDGDYFWFDEIAWNPIQVTEYMLQVFLSHTSPAFSNWAEEKAAQFNMTREEFLTRLLTDIRLIELLVIVFMQSNLHSTFPGMPVTILTLKDEVLASATHTGDTIANGQNPLETIPEKKKEPWLEVLKRSFQKPQPVSKKEPEKVAWYRRVIAVSEEKIRGLVDAKAREKGTEEFLDSFIPELIHFVKHSRDFKASEHELVSMKKELDRYVGLKNLFSFIPRSDPPARQDGSPTKNSTDPSGPVADVLLSRAEMRISAAELVKRERQLDQWALMAEELKKIKRLQDTSEKAFRRQRESIAEQVMNYAMSDEVFMDRLITADFEAAAGMLTSFPYLKKEDQPILKVMLEIVFPPEAATRHLKASWLQVICCGVSGLGLFLKNILRPKKTFQNGTQGSKSESPAVFTDTTSSAGRRSEMRAEEKNLPQTEGKLFNNLSLDTLAETLAPVVLDMRDRRENVYVEGKNKRREVIGVVRFQPGLQIALAPRFAGRSFYNSHDEFAQKAGFTETVDEKGYARLWLTFNEEKELIRIGLSPDADKIISSDEKRKQLAALALMTAKILRSLEDHDLDFKLGGFALEIGGRTSLLGDHERNAVWGQSQSSIEMLDRLSTLGTTEPGVQEMRSELRETTGDIVLRQKGRDMWETERKPDKMVFHFETLEMQKLPKGSQRSRAYEFRTVFKTLFPALAYEAYKGERSFALNPDRINVLLLSEGKPAGFYSYSKLPYQRNQLLGFGVIQDYRGTGAEDVLWEDIKARVFYNNPKARIIVPDIALLNSRAAPGRFEGTAEDLKSALGIEGAAPKEESSAGQGVRADETIAQEHAFEAYTKRIFTPEFLKKYETKLAEMRDAIGLTLRSYGHQLVNRQEMAKEIVDFLEQSAATTETRLSLAKLPQGVTQEGSKRATFFFFINEEYLEFIGGARYDEKGEEYHHGRLAQAFEIDLTQFDHVLIYGSAEGASPKNPEGEISLTFLENHYPQEKGKFLATLLAAGGVPLSKKINVRNNSVPVKSIKTLADMLSFNDGSSAPRSETRAPLNLTIRYSQDFYNVIARMQANERYALMNRLYRFLRSAQHTTSTTGVGKPLTGGLNMYKEFQWGDYRILFIYNIHRNFPENDPARREFILFLCWYKKWSIDSQKPLNDEARNNKAIQKILDPALPQDGEKIQQLLKWFYEEREEKPIADLEDFDFLNQVAPSLLFSPIQKLDLEDLRGTLEANLKVKESFTNAPILYFAIHDMQAALEKEPDNLEKAAHLWLGKSGTVPREEAERAKQFLRQWTSAEYRLLALIENDLKENESAQGFRKALGNIAWVYFELAEKPFRKKIQQKIEEWAQRRPETSKGLGQIQAAYAQLRKGNAGEDVFSSPLVEKMIEARKEWLRSPPVVKKPVLKPEPAAVSPAEVTPVLAIRREPEPASVPPSIEREPLKLPDTPVVKEAIGKAKKLFEDCKIRPDLITDANAETALAVALDPQYTFKEAGAKLEKLFESSIGENTAKDLRKELEQLGFLAALHQMNQIRALKHLTQMFSKAEVSFESGDVIQAETLVKSAIVADGYGRPTEGKSSLDSLLGKIKELEESIKALKKWTAVLLENPETSAPLSKADLDKLVAEWDGFSKKQQKAAEHLLSSETSRGRLKDNLANSFFVAAFLLPFVREHKASSGWVEILIKDPAMIRDMNRELINRGAKVLTETQHVFPVSPKGSLRSEVRGKKEVTLVMPKGPYVFSDFESQEDLAPEVRAFDLKDHDMELSFNFEAFDAQGKSRFYFDRIHNILFFNGVPLAFYGKERDENSPLEEIYQTPDELAAGHSPSKVDAILPSGNLGQNDWFVAIVDDKVYHYSKDPLDRVYDMLLVKEDGTLEVRSLRFKDQKGMRGIYDKNYRSIPFKIRYGFYGQRLVKDRKLNLAGVATQFDDLRHLFRFPRFKFSDDREVHLGFSDDEGELYRDPHKIEKALRGETIGLSLRPLLDMGVSVDQVEAIFEAWGYIRLVMPVPLAEFKPGEYFINEEKNIIWVKLLPGIHPHNFFGLDQNGKFLTGAVPGDTHFEGATLETLGNHLIERYRARDIFIWGNGKDSVLSLPREKEVFGAKHKREKFLSAILVVPKQFRSETRESEIRGKEEQAVLDRIEAYLAAMKIGDELELDIMKAQWMDELGRAGSRMMWSDLYGILSVQLFPKYGIVYEPHKTGGYFKRFPTKGPAQENIRTPELAPAEELKMQAEAEMNREELQVPEDLKDKIFIHDSHRFAYYQIKKAVETQKIPSGLPLLLLDQHSDNKGIMLENVAEWHGITWKIPAEMDRASGQNILDSGNWINYLQKDKLVGPVFWAYPYGREIFMGEGQQAFEAQGATLRKILKDHPGSFQDGVILSLDLDYFASQANDKGEKGYRPPKGEIKQKMENIFNLLRTYGVKIRLLNAAYSLTPFSYAPSDYKPEFQEALRETIRANTELFVRSEARKKESSQEYTEQVEKVLDLLGGMKASKGRERQKAFEKIQQWQNWVAPEDQYAADRFKRKDERVYAPLEIITGHLKNPRFYPEFEQEIVEFLFWVHADDQPLFEKTVEVLFEDAAFQRQSPDEGKRKQGEASTGLLRELLMQASSRDNKTFLRYLEKMFRGLGKNRSTAEKFIGELMVTHKNDAMGRGLRDALDKVWPSRAEIRVSMDAAEGTFRQSKVSKMTRSELRDLLEQVMPNAYPEKTIQATRFAKAREMLGVKTVETQDALILTKEFAFDRKALLAVQKVFSGTEIVVLADEDQLSQADRDFLDQLPQANRPYLVSAALLNHPKVFSDALRKLLGRTAVGRSVHFKAMAGANDPAAELLKSQFDDDAILLTERTFENFLNIAGVSALVNAMTVQYKATAKSA